MSTEEPLTLETADGVRLSALVRRPPDARRGVVLCHPHPDYGGSMHVPVLDVLSDRLGREGLATLRFDLRRPGTVTERLRDVEAAVSAMGASVLLVGWSYGADLALATAAADNRVASVVAIAPPLHLESVDEAVATRALFLIPEHDQFNPPERASAQLPGARIEVVEGADHFLAGHEEDIADAVVAFERTV